MAKKLKGDTVAPLGAGSSVVVAPSSVGRGGSGARTSPARSSSRGQEERPGEVPAPVAPLTMEAPVLDAVDEVAKAQELPASQAVITLPSSPPAPLVPDSSASSAVLDRAAAELGRLREDLQGANPAWWPGAWS